MGILLIAGGLACVFYFRPKTLNDVMEMKFLQTKKISEVRDMFNQMDATGVGDSYREYVELKGVAVSDQDYETAFSNQKVAYCESEVLQVTEEIEHYKDQEGHDRTRRIKHETTISNEKSSQYISLDDNSGENVVLEINATGCKLDIPKTFDRFENRDNIGNYNYFRRNSFLGRSDNRTLGYRLIEKTIRQRQNLYVIGEAFKVGNEIHIGKPQDAKKPFIVSTKSEEDVINTADNNAKMLLFGGIIAAVIGVFVMIKAFIG